MGGWQPLPDDLPPEVRHFVEQLRLLKDRTGLSLVALGARTAYSKSSWHRYLNAGQPPPRQAVVALCRIAGLADPHAERFGVRWELAVQAWPRPATVPAPSAGSDAGGDPGAGTDGDPSGEYEDDPTPWWDTPPRRTGVGGAGCCCPPCCCSFSRCWSGWPARSRLGEPKSAVTGVISDAFPLCRCIDKFAYVTRSESTWGLTWPLCRRSPEPRPGGRATVRARGHDASVRPRPGN